MAMNWQSDEYKSAVAAKGGGFDSKGAETTQNTWGTEAVNPNDWQNGGWYTNPNSGRVERWWADGGNSGGGSNQSLTSSFSSGGGQALQGTVMNSGNISLPERPTVNLAEQYKSLYDTMGIQSYRDQMTDYTNQINALQEELTGKLNTLRADADQAAALINENPWASSANRTGRLAKLEQQYQNKAALVQNEYKTKFDTLQNTMTNVQNQYQMAMGDLTTQMNLYTQQYQFDMTNFDANLAQLNTLLDMGALDYATSEDLQQLAAQTGMSDGLIASMIQANQSSKYQPQLLTHTDDYGNVVASLVDTKTGKLLNQESLGKIDASRITPSSLSGGSLSGSLLYDPLTGKNASPENYKSLLFQNDIDELINQNMSWAEKNGRSVDTYKYVWPDQALQLYRQSGLTWKKFLETIQGYMKPSDFRQLKKTYDDEEDW